MEKSRAEATSLQQIARDLAYETIFQDFPISYYQLDKEGTFVDCNENVLDILGFQSFEQIIGKKIYDIPEISPEAWENSQACILKKERHTVEEVHEDENGLKHYFLSIKDPILDEQGNAQGIIGISIDITKQKEMEHQLIEAKEKAEVAAQTKEAVVYNLRHDWISPFCGIYSLNEQLAKLETDPEKKKMLTMATEASQQMMEHTKAILEMIQAAEGIPPVQEKPINLEQVINDVYQMYLPESHRCKIIFKLDMNDCPSLVRGDQLRTERILMCLLSNALKFTAEKGMVNVSVKVEKETEIQYVINFIFEDNGIGMTPQQVDEIYEPLYRGTPAYEGKFRGAGTGLAIVKQFISDMNGQIVCQSKLGEGTTFVATLIYKKPLISQQTLDTL